MTDAEIISAIERGKANAKKHSIIIIVIVAVILFAAIIILKVFPGAGKENKELRKDIKALQVQMDSLNRTYSIDSIDRVKVKEEQEVQRAERAAMAQEIRRLTNQLSKFSKQYATIPKYNIPADSLLQLFNKRFNY